MKPIIYQVFTRLFGNRNATDKPWGTVVENGVGKMNDLDDATLRRIKRLGATHVWFTGVVRHASQTDHTAHGIPRQHPDVVKGVAGSPYAIADYYDIDPDIAVDVDRRMEEWVALVERTHRAGMKVVMDFVPNHVAREYRSICRPNGVSDLGEDDSTDLRFARDNNFYYIPEPLDLSDICGSTGGKGYEECPARATGNDVFSAKPSRNDWYETVKLNYGVDYCDAGGRSEHFSPIPDTWGKMADILLFWARTGADAFRCDMAEMVPAEFWAWATDVVRAAFPEIKFIGEVYNPSLYRKYIDAGFDWLYDKVGMYDCVRDVICGRRRASDITEQWQNVGGIVDHMLYFLENHDEQRIASDFFAADTYLGANGKFVTEEEYPKFVRQELIVNAVTHRAYSISGTDIQIKMFDNRIVVESPGKLPGLVKTDNMRYTHFSRNPKIAEFLKAYNFVKEYGEGVNRMCIELETVGLKEPEYYTNAFMLQATIYNGNKNSSGGNVAIDTEDVAIDTKNVAIDTTMDFK